MNSNAEEKAFADLGRLMLKAAQDTTQHGGDYHQNLEAVVAVWHSDMTLILEGRAAPSDSLKRLMDRLGECDPFWGAELIAPFVQFAYAHLLEESPSG